MISNRESAKRSRMRRQKHLDDLTGQITHLRYENNQILTNMSIVTHLYMNVESENSVLRAQMSELNHRLQALIDIINSMNSIGDGFEGDFDDYDHMISGNYNDDFLYHWSLTHVSQPIMASPDVFMC
ncbi:hypothetical protein BUALT_Bualt04G0005000 [Buddleja alternifolia]|uniref:BZIP domain-containing protein n=1 Tax=Buddleja alternifolia TaxID=168488 RepID=A0AAV6XVV3_9LAMI|nr:hypothetical protein BUALT_Bualt04G0005000 [Buddleja alternifolia]